jgi:hypothetical protein
MASQRKRSAKQLAKMALETKKKMYSRLIEAHRKQIKALELMKEVIVLAPEAAWSQDKRFVSLFYELLHQHPLGKSAPALAAKSAAAGK